MSLPAMLAHTNGFPTQAALKPFLDADFLLKNEVAAELYHAYAASQPIIDYHCHLSPRDIAENRQFQDLTEIWLEGDHYKWRAMRTNGVSEHYITGKASNWEKFEQWAATVPDTLRNPLYHWTHLELRRYFDIDAILSPKTARAVYEEANSKLAALTTQDILRKMNVRVVCTTDDPIDDLRYHRQYQASGQTMGLYPAFRPDKAILIQLDAFPTYLQALGAAAAVEISDFTDICAALSSRMDYFETLGCCVSDHGLERLYAAEFTEAQANAVLQKRLQGHVLTVEEAEIYQSAVLHFLGTEYARRGWVQQFHLGALRNNNPRMLRTLGPDTGFDSIGDWSQAQTLARFLARLEENNQLAKTIIYNLNPADNAVFGTMIGNFNDGSVAGKVQWGSGWWFLDQKHGMEAQLNDLSNLGLLARFVGMLTDSRSFMSFPRHEYFRRILCNLIGQDVQNGELPYDVAWLGGVVQNICYGNAAQYFPFRQEA